MLFATHQFGLFKLQKNKVVFAVIPQLLNPFCDKKDEDVFFIGPNRFLCIFAILIF